MSNWSLIDTTEYASQYKYTFYLPSAEVMQKIAVGENVKLMFGFESNIPCAFSAERMWVRVDSIDGHGGYTGQLNNVPAFIDDLSPGDPISFRDIHIINTDHDDDGNIVDQYLSRCFVSNRILKDGLEIGSLCRDEPENDEDSGWWITAGDESEEYLDSPESMAYVSLGTVLNLDDSIIHLLDSPVGAAFERIPDKTEYRYSGRP